MTPLDVIEGRAKWCVVHGDNAAVLPTLADKSVAHVITDPPYSEHVHGKSRRGASLPDGGGDHRGGSSGAAPGCISRARELGFDALTREQMERCADQFARLCRRWCLVFSDLESTGDWRSELKVSGLEHVRVGLWEKIGATPQFTGDRPATAAEAINISHPRGRKRWNGGGKHGIWKHPIALERGDGTLRVHTTQKPESLMLELIEDFTDLDDIVLDPFCGSGTTGVACLRLGRRFIGIEKDAKYAAVSVERLTAESQGLSLKAARAGQLPMFGEAKP